jgi:hypothetical protein
MGEHGWEPADLSSYENEAELERLLLSDTSLIPGAEGAAAVTQFSLGGGAVDLLCIDEHGSLTVVECKLKTNREVRRQVVGQVLAYAAALADLSAEDVLDRFNSRLSAMADKAPAASLSRDVQSALAISAGHEVDINAVRENVQTNLDRDAVRLVIAVDGVVDELRAVVEYLSAHTPPQIHVVALEVGQFQQDDVRLLAVNSYGNEIELDAAVTATSHKHKWTRDEVEQALEDLLDAEKRLVVQLLHHADSHQAVFNGGTGPDPSAGLYYQILDKRRSFWSMWMIKGKEAISINLGSINNASPVIVGEVIGVLLEAEFFRQKLSTLSDVEKRYPNFLISELAEDEAARGALIRALDVASKK